MKLYTTLFDRAADTATARASWPLPEPALAYFPNARSATSDRDLDAGAATVAPARFCKGAVMPDDHPHDPVLLDRCVELLKPALTWRDPDGAGATLVDATLGAGGHAERFLTDLPGLRVIGLDRDRTALQIAGERLAPFGDRVTFVHTRYDGFWNDGDAVDGALFDLGVSSMQLDRAERGFSYSQDAPLDMRMDQDAPLTTRRSRFSGRSSDSRSGRVSRLERGARVTAISSAIRTAAKTSEHTVSVTFHRAKMCEACTPAGRSAVWAGSAFARNARLPEKTMASRSRAGRRIAVLASFSGRP